MWLGACVSTIGTWMQSTAQSWLIYDLSGKSELLGLDGFLGQIPIVLLTLFGGVLADRINRRYILLASQFLQMACAAILTILLLMGVISKSNPIVWPILILSFLVGTAQAFGGPAYSALVPSLVDKEDLPNAISLNSIQFNLARVIGPALGGMALKTLGAAWCFGMNAVSYLAVIATLIIVRPAFTPKATTAGVFESMRQGIDFVRTRAAMVPLIALTFSMTFLSVSLLQFLPVFSREVLHADSDAFTTLLSASGFGSICGALIVAAFARRRGLGRPSLIVLATLGLLTIAFSFSRSLWLCTAIIFLCGACLISMFAMLMSMVQSIITDDMRGRVMSVYNLSLRGGMPLGALLSGYLIPHFTLPVVLTWNGVLLVVLAVYFWMVHPDVAAL
ncbi:MFS transporter [Bryobacterales bacterium F-183]|nr:MFS transporter [Bryobacterales bacterium F-183]